MPAATTISVEQYLATTYRPDRDYIDGELRERNAGEYLHWALQAQFGFLFNLNAKSWGTRVSMEQRLRSHQTVSHSRCVRVPGRRRN